MPYTPDISVAAYISATLQGVPNKSIDPRLWNELTRIQGSLKAMASLVDSIKALPTRVIQPITYYQGEGFALTLQDKDQVDVIAGEAIDAQMVVTFKPTSSGIRAYKTSQGDPIDGFTVAAVSAGSVGTFILKGLIVYSRTLPLDIVSSSPLITRPSNQFGRLAFYNPFIPQTDKNSDHRGMLTFENYSYYMNPCKVYAGTIIGTLNPPSNKPGNLYLHGNTWLSFLTDPIVYFNPKHYI